MKKMLFCKQAHINNLQVRLCMKIIMPHKLGVTTLPNDCNDSIAIIYD